MTKTKDDLNGKAEKFNDEKKQEDEGKRQQALFLREFGREYSPKYNGEREI